MDSGLLLNLCFSLQWFTLDEVCKGKLHLKLEWLTLMPDTSALDKVRGLSGWPPLALPGSVCTSCCAPQ